MVDQVSGSEKEQFWMQRSVSQLLFSYLPGKTVDWEDGTAIVQLGGVQLESAWEAKKSQVVYKEIDAYLQRWKREGGMVHPSFPNPYNNPERFTIGEPSAIAASILDTALYCLSCHRLVFTKKSEWATQKPGNRPFHCPTCKRATLRQFPQIFVHGCGNIVTLHEWMPTVKKNDNTITKVNYPLQCPKCGKSGIVEIPSRSERARDLVVRCRHCQQIIVDRLSARCHECVSNLPPTPLKISSETKNTKEPTLIDRVLMRSTSYRASEAYYPHTITLLRLDRSNVAFVDEEATLLREMLPGEEFEENASQTTTTQILSVLQTHLQEALANGDTTLFQELLEKIGKIATTGQAEDVNKNKTSINQLSQPHAALTKSVTESLAFKTKVHTKTYEDILKLDQKSATAGLLPEIHHAHTYLGLRDTLLVEDLPLITATFGYTRRSFEPTYEENGRALLPTRLCQFPSLQDFAAKKINRPNAGGTIPILAREGEHEGIFLGLDPERVLQWVVRNGGQVPDTNQPAIVRLMRAIEQEEADRYYDTIWTSPHLYNLRLIFGLLHSLSHAAMRIVSQFAGLERTSVSEYLFLPLLGTVIYANSTTFKMGCMETMIRSSFFEFLSALSKEAMSCLIDPDCLDHTGACAGCLHSPDISCRVFNHGLSRAFLVGGHMPWVDAAIEKNIIGFWER